MIGDERTLLPDALELLARRRAARRRRLRRAALHDRRPGARAAPGGRRLRGGHAARLADRLGHGDPQPLQPRADPRADAAAGDPRRGRRHRLRRRAGDGARLRRACCARARSPARRTRSRWRARSAPASRPGGSRAAPGRIPRRLHAEASTPDEGMPELARRDRSRDAGPSTTLLDALPGAPGRAATAPRLRAVCAPDVHYEDPLTGDAAARARRARRPRRAALGGVPRREGRARRRAARATGASSPRRCKLAGTHLGELDGPAARPAASSSCTPSSTASSTPTGELLWRVRAFFDALRGGRRSSACCRARHGGRARADAPARLRAARVTAAAGPRLSRRLVASAGRRDRRRGREQLAHPAGAQRGPGRLRGVGGGRWPAHHGDPGRLRLRARAARAARRPVGAPAADHRRPVRHRRRRPRPAPRPRRSACSARRSSCSA